MVAEGRGAEALGHLATAVRLSPGFAEMHYNYGHALAVAGRRPEAITEFTAALNGVTDSPAVRTAAHAQLGNAFALSERPAEAVPHYEAVLRARSDDAEAHHNLGSALFELGRLGEAAQHYEAALRIAPEFSSARANLKRVRAQLRR